MFKFVIRFIALLSSILFLASCFGPKTPQAVTQAFWQAVINNDTSDVVEYSTLTATKSYDGFSMDWQGYESKLGRITIDGNAASVVTELSKPADSGHAERKFVTYLVKRNGRWIVDYERTKAAVHGGALGNLLNTLNQFGNDLSKQLDSTAENFKHAMDRMSQQLEQMAKSFSAEASKSLNKYADELRQSIQELEDSINRALKDDKNLSSHDRNVLRVAAKDLEQNRASLANPSVEVVSNCSRSIGNTSQQLETVNSGDAGKYKAEWRELSREIKSEMQQMLDDLSADLNASAT